MKNTLRKTGFGQRTFILALALLVCFVFGGLAQASVLVPAMGVELPPDIFTTCTGCTLLASTGPQMVLSSNSNWEVNLIAAVYMDPNAVAGVRTGAGLDFMYQATNVTPCAGCTSGPDAIGRVTAINFTGFGTDVGYNTGGAALGDGFTNGTSTPGLVDRNTADTIGWGFSVPGSVPLLPGDTSVVLEVETNATSYTQGHAAALDGGTANVLSYQPASVPEPASTLLMAGGLLALAGLRRFRR